jgi:phosphoglycolate phosphatase-like HAD superfamily hydrolase
VLPAVSHRVVLFDLDGTVLTFDGSPPGPGRVALARAMDDLHSFGHMIDGLRLAGGTDRALVRTMLLRAGLADDDVGIARVLAAYVENLEAILRTRRYHPIGDVDRVVTELRAHGAVVGIATGNVREGAKRKLASAGLDTTFHLERGGFGCDAELRADIVRIAAERCGVDHRTDLVVVGDTEHDVRAGRAVGARVVGVATDDLARAELEAAGADVIVQACSDQLVAAVLG